MVKKGLIKKGFVWFALAGFLAGQGTDLLAEQKNIAAGQKKNTCRLVGDDGGGETCLAG